ncbi:MAG TPA: nucleoside deaminase [Gammaproteobacteria bacterium]|nr:nucleoside deaminase [Gammaproteobacteria bacterium]
MSDKKIESKNEAMQLAIDSAFVGLKNKEGGPFGAAILQNGKVIAVAHNTVLKDKDPTCHSEINAIRQACKNLNTHILSGCEIYSTAEPCPMCLAAIYWARLDKIFIGVDKSIAAKYGFDDAKFYEQILLGLERREIPIQCGILAKECEEVFSHWKEIEGVLY